MTESTTHIRPRKKTTRSPTAAAPTIDDELETTRQRVESWTGLAKASSSTPAASSLTTPTTVNTPSSSSIQPKSILRQPKYHGRAAVEDQKDELTPILPRSSTTTTAIGHVVIERKKKTKARATTTSISATAVEGYVPKQQPTAPVANNKGALPAAKQKEPTDDEPLIFNSLADLMKKAGTLPEQPQPGEQIAPGSVLEAELAFACLDPQTYEQQVEEERQTQYDVFLGHDNVFGDGSDTENEDPTDDDSDDGVLDLVGDDDEEPDNESVHERQPRAFLVLWQALSQWVTPDAVAFLRRLPESSEEAHNWQPVYDRSDIGTSRCAGLMALLSMHLRRCLPELERSPEEIRAMERRLADLVRCFDYARPMPRFDTPHARAITCILLETLDDKPVEGVPPSCEALGLTLEEYRYLTRSAIVNFGTPNDQ